MKTYEASCKKIVDATKELTTSSSSLAAQAGSDPEKAVTAFKDAATKLFDTFGSELKTLADAKAPDKFADFQDSIKDSSDKTDDAIAKAKSEVSNIKSLQDISGLGEKLDGINIDGGKDLPKELAEKAPSCATLDRQ
ncbi:hypothetical protein [Patulibacter minatonensis]|uniref:hypothetical protein n=1 Tax=Patulibacter minatonensis TaxID=298163 RepID=UPI000479450D|nr:hypothetical protein [Patulibacter minatonensis]